MSPFKARGDFKKSRTETTIRQNDQYRISVSADGLLLQ